MTWVFLPAQTYCRWKLLMYSVNGNSRIKIAYVYIKLPLQLQRQELSCFPLQGPRHDSFFLKHNNAYSSFSGTNIYLPKKWHFYGIFAQLAWEFAQWAQIFAQKKASPVNICPVGMKVCPKTVANPTYIFAQGQQIFAQKKGYPCIYLPSGHESLPQNSGKSCIYTCPLATDICPKRGQSCIYVCPIGTRISPKVAFVWT